MDLSNLTYFLAAADTLNFKKAADKLFISPRRSVSASWR